MLDYNKPIPTIEFPKNGLEVANPSQEEMVYLDDMFVCASAYNQWVEQDGKPLPGSSPSIMVRKTVAEMLKKAAAKLPEGYSFKIYDAYRPIAVQQALWDYFRAQKRAENPSITEEELDHITKFCVSFPSYNILKPSLHNTGGAVDLTIIDKDGNEVDMGCGFDEFTDRAWTTYYEPDSEFDGDNDVARDNRRMLYNIMIDTGFTNFPSEWWHFDYGDEKWGQLTNNVPIYGGILDADVRNSVPYDNMELVKEANAEEQKVARQINDLRDECIKLDEKVAAVMRG